VKPEYSFQEKGGGKDKSSTNAAHRQQEIKRRRLGIQLRVLMVYRTCVIRTCRLTPHYRLFTATVNVTAWEIDSYFERLSRRRFRVFVSASSLPTYCFLFYWIFNFIGVCDRHKLEDLLYVCRGYGRAVLSLLF